MATNNSTNTTLQGQSGTGSFAGSTSPVFTTPTLGVASATSISFGGSALATYTAPTSWTPVVTFVTPGDLSVSYSSQLGIYSRIGDIVEVNFTLVFTPTYTTSSGNLNITGLPFTCKNTSGNNAVGNILIQNPNFPASTSSLFCEITPNTSLIVVGASGSGVSAAFFSVTQITTGVARTMIGSIRYFV